MKLAITVGEQGNNPNLERRFGRCEYFLIVDTETNERAILSNPSTSARGGAGTQAAQFLAENDVEAVISGNFGPNAFTALDAAGIHMFSAQMEQVEKLIEEFKADRLTRVTSNTSQRRSGEGRSRRGRGR
jgi:predicted Fe-Mo cluster-binding NifX family protein